MIKLTIDGKLIEVEEGLTILEAAKRLGINIPHFCYHPALSIAGNCRMCAVEVEGQSKPVMSCREPVKDGMAVHTTSSMALDLRRSVLEFMLINHPIDCPVCDQSGECLLQDYYFEHSLGPSRFGEEKVRKPKAVRIGPNVMLDAERCIECTRCIRFCEEITKTNELTMELRSDDSKITVFKRHALDNPYSLCTVDLCPVGALTSSDFRFKKRVWFLTSSPSICNSCATGCNILIDHHDNIVYRYRPRENTEINGPWLCDEGRLSYKKINAENRLLFPYVVADGKHKRVSWGEALIHIAGLIRSLKSHEIAGILSARSTVEENEAFAAFLRDVIKTPNIYWSGLDPDLNFADRLLRDSDRNPNTKGVTAITQNRLDKTAKARGYFILDWLTNEELTSTITSKPDWVVLITSHLSLPLCKPVPSEVEGGEPEGVDRYSEQSLPSLTLPYKGRGLSCVLLPKATFAEQAGTFVNRKGMRQRFEMAIEPRGETLSAVDIAGKLSECVIARSP